MRRVQADQWAAFCAERTEVAFAPIYEATKGLVFTLCYRILRNEDDARDAFQSAYARLIAAAADPREASTIDDVDPWLARTAVREADSLRKRRARRSRREQIVDKLPSTPAPGGIPARTDARPGGPLLLAGMTD